MEDGLAAALIEALGEEALEKGDRGVLWAKKNVLERRISVVGATVSIAEICPVSKIVEFVARGCNLGGSAGLCCGSGGRNVCGAVADCLFLLGSIVGEVAQDLERRICITVRKAPWLDMHVTRWEERGISDRKAECALVHGERMKHTASVLRFSCGSCLVAMLLPRGDQGQRTANAQMLVYSTAR